MKDSDSPFIIILTIVIITLLSILILSKEKSSIYFEPNTTHLMYRSVENTGYRGEAEYYVFDDNGVRYLVTQKYFDSRVDLERR